MYGKISYFHGGSMTTFFTTLLSCKFKTCKMQNVNPFFYLFLLSYSLQFKTTRKSLWQQIIIQNWNFGPCKFFKWFYGVGSWSDKFLELWDKN